MSSFDNLAKDLYKIFHDSEQKGPKPYEPVAEVVKIDESDPNIVWVKIPGGETETPVEKTVNAKVGDKVRLRVSGGRAWVLGNSSNPPTDDTTANYAQATATKAIEIGETAIQDAERAYEAANRAESDAERAYAAANRAEIEAGRAYTEAERATGYANDALTQLSTVENVVDTLNWITEHGTMTLTTDTEIDPTHVYFVVDPNGDYIVANTHYSIVTEPVASALSTYYVLSIDEAVSNYVATHLALTNDGLYVVKDNQGYKVLLSNTGLQIQDAGGHTVATFGENITFDSARPQTIGNQSTYIKWYDSDNDHIADSIEIAGSNVNIASSVTIGGMPTKVSDLQNDSGYQTANDVTSTVNTATSGLLSSVSTKDQYYLSTSSSSATGGSWQDTVPTWSTGKYIWTRVATTKTTSSGSTTSYSTAVYDSALTSALSDLLDKADSTEAVASVVTTQQYYLSTSASSATGGSWQDTVPTWSTGKYIWKRFKIVATPVSGAAETSYSPSSAGVYDSALTTALSTSANAAPKSSAVNSTVSIYYRSTTQSTPTISTSTAIGTSASTDNEWEYVMPQPKKNCYFYTCEKYIYADGNVSFSTVRSLDNATYTSKWCSSADNVYIDGGAIYANSVTSDQIAANTITIGNIATSTQENILNSNIEVGGRNLVLASDNVVEKDLSTSGNLSLYGYLSDYGETALGVIGTTATVSFEAKASDEGLKIAELYICDDNGDAVSNYGGASAITLTTSYVRYEGTCEINDTGASRIYFYTGDNTETSGTVYVRNVKVEVGNKATDWTPAPEDVDSGISDAATKATNYITVIDGNGIKVHAQNNVNSNYTQIDSTGMDIYKGGVSVAKYGDTVRIGKDSNAHLEVTSNSIVLNDSIGTAFFKVRDEANETGEVTDTFIGDDETTEFTLSYTANDSNYTVTVDGTTASPTKSTTAFVFASAPSTGAEITAIYTVSSNAAKGYDFGIRKAGTLTGKLSVIEGTNTTASGNFSHAEGGGTIASNSQSHAEGYHTTASGHSSHAEGYETVASGSQSHAEGRKTTASGKYSHAAGYETIANYQYETVVGRYNTTSFASWMHGNIGGSPLFVVGNGTAAARDNAFVVGADGSALDGTGYKLLNWNDIDSVEYKVKSGLSVSSGNTTSGSGSFTKAGYIALGVVGWRCANGNGSGGSYALPHAMYTSMTETNTVTVHYGIRAVGGSVSNCDLYVTVLWKRQQYI